MRLIFSTVERSNPALPNWIEPLPASATVTLALSAACVPSMTSTREVAAYRSASFFLARGAEPALAGLVDIVDDPHPLLTPLTVVHVHWRTDIGMPFVARFQRLTCAHQSAC